MSGVDRDIQCGNSFAKLYELGCFDEEFIVYGCGYYQNGEIIYLISNDGERVYRFRNEALLNHIYTTPVIMKVVTCQVSSGERENIRQSIKVDLAKDIKAIYSREYYEILSCLDQVQPNQHAEEFLQREQKQLEGYFDKTSVEMFEGLCKLAYECKKIKEHSYQSFNNWIKYAKRQMENDIIVKDNLRRQFHGFGYEQNGVVRYYADAQVMNVYKKREELMLQNAVVTPILSKEYWFKAVNQLHKVRKEFMEYLKYCIENGYLEKTKKILLAKSPFDEKISEEFVWNDLTAEENKAIKVYKNIMGIKM